MIRPEDSPADSKELGAAARDDSRDPVSADDWCWFGGEELLFNRFIYCDAAWRVLMLFIEDIGWIDPKEDDPFTPK